MSAKGRTKTKTTTRAPTFPKIIIWIKRKKTDKVDKNPANEEHKVLTVNSTLDPGVEKFENS
jgi:hypothetical protein